ncbi:serine--tRNA ligase, partial [Shewanella sp. SR41-2]|nr:serine--tRNA ligase [Shewanella sp. SR41-2]
MLDPKFLRNELEITAERLATRGFILDVDNLTKLEEKRKSLQVATEDLQASRNAISKSIGQAKARGEDTSSIMAQVGDLGAQLDAKKAELAELLQQINSIAMSMPNLPDESAPVGADENDNVEVRRWGTPKVFDFEVKDHLDLGEALGGLDFKSAVKITGSRFIIMRGQI